MNDPIVRLQRVTRTFGDVVALDGFDFEILPGEIVALLGANGAGKTTAVRTILGLLRPDAGEVTVFGHAPRDWRARSRIGTLLQVGKIPETLKVREHVELFTSYYPSPLPVERAIGAAGLEGLEERKFGHLSGGQQQRLLFALSICGNPDLVILDEPTTGLDVDVRRQLWQQISAFTAGGRSILLTTHYLEEADALADRIAVVHEGRLVAEGAPSEIKRRVAGTTIRCRTSLSIERIRSIEGVQTCEASSGLSIIRASHPENVLRQLLSLDPDLSDLEVNRAKLEEAFLEITGHEPSEEVA